jgi:starch phosphorylase
VRDRLFQRGVQSLDLLLQHPEARVVAYLSAEFLMGPQLAANLINLAGIMQRFDGYAAHGIAHA